jgi:hypothetical protein
MKAASTAMDGVSHHPAKDIRDDGTARSASGIPPCKTARRIPRGQGELFAHVHLFGTSEFCYAIQFGLRAHSRVDKEYTIRIWETRT